MMRFATTRWSLILDARQQGSKVALEAICRDYRAPVLAYVRRHGYSLADAEDLTQEFFARFLEGQWDAGLDPARGHFRGFLLMAIRRFLISTYESGQSLRHGGGLVRTGDREIEQLAASDDQTPEETFDRAWALAVLDHALIRLRNEATRAGKQELFEQLGPYVIERPDRNEYDQVAAALGLRTNTVAVAVHRLRARLRELVREELVSTCNGAHDVDTELHALRDTLRHLA